MLFSTLFSLLPLLCSAAQDLATSVPGSVPGTTSHYAEVGGNTYHYLRSRPSSTPVGTILLLHGYPDFSYGWRYQIPYLTSLGYQVITPDMLGYADTDAPAEFAEYTRKKISTDMALLMDSIIPGQQVIVGGHDWGAALAYKMAIWYPDLIRAYFTISVPYWPPVFGLSAAPFVDIPALVQNATYHTLGYQRQWRDFDFERHFETETEIHTLMNAAYGGLTPDNKSALSPWEGWNFTQLPLLRPQTLMNPSDLDFYTQSFLKKGLRGPSNWYRIYHLDWEDELEVARAGNYVYHMPVLFIRGAEDPIFPNRTLDWMPQHFENLSMQSAETGHWVMQEAPDVVNGFLEQWLSGLGN